MDLRDPRVRYLSVAIVLLVIGAIGAVILLGPGREARQDLDEIETDLTSQLEVTREMLETTEAMLGTTQRQVDLTEQEMVTRLEDQRQLVTETVQLQREMLELMRAMLVEMRELNDKMPPPTGGELVPQP
jgi:hypothetical protein